MRGEIVNFLRRDSRLRERSKECPRNGATLEIADSL